MKIRVVLGWFAFFATCVFCHRDFESLGRHQWRCRKKLNDQQEDTRQRTYSNNPSPIQLDHGNNEIEEANERLLSSNSEICCVCGKVCEGNRGLKSHQRTCRTIRGLNQAEPSARSDIFFCLKTNWRRVGVKRQKKISFRAENST